jgi:hypothetical protein
MTQALHLIRKAAVALCKNQPSPVRRALALTCNRRTHKLNLLRVDFCGHDSPCRWNWLYPVCRTLYTKRMRRHARSWQLWCASSASQPPKQDHDQAWVPGRTRPPQAGRLASNTPSPSESPRGPSRLWRSYVELPRVGFHSCSERFFVQSNGWPPPGGRQPARLRLESAQAVVAILAWTQRVNDLPH